MNHSRRIHYNRDIGSKMHSAFQRKGYRPETEGF
jgi:hypothetical protein